MKLQVDWRLIIALVLLAFYAYTQARHRGDFDDISPRLAPRMDRSIVDSPG